MRNDRTTTGGSARDSRNHGRRIRPWQVAGVLALLVLVSAQPALACPACFGAVGEIDSPMADGMNNGILVLLGVVGTVQGGFAVFFVTLWRRQRKRQARKDSFDVIDGGLR